MDGFTLQTMSASSEEAFIVLLKRIQELIEEGTVARSIELKGPLEITFWIKKGKRVWDRNEREVLPDRYSAQPFWTICNNCGIPFDKLKSRRCPECYPDDENKKKKTPKIEMNGKKKK